VPELTNGRELRALRVGEALNRGTPQVWGLSVPVPRPRGRELANFPEVPGAGGVSTCPTLMVAMELQYTFIHDGNSNHDSGSIVHATEIAQSQGCSLIPCNLVTA